jgi:hypothetical protein
MSRNILNDLSGDITTNVYINTIDVFEGTLPVVVAQANPNEQVNISLKDINGFGGADKILVTNTSNDGLVWAEQSWKRIASSYLQPYNITDVVSIPPDSYIRFDTEPISALGFELKHDETNNNFVFREKDGTQIYKYTPTVDIFNPSSFEFGESDNERIVLSANNLRLNNRGSVSFREDASNGTSQISVQAPASLTTSATVTLPSSNGTLALTTDNTGLIQSVSSPLAVSSNNLTLGTVPYNLGGTGLTSYTTGDILYSSATNTLAKRGIGSTGQVLKVSGGIPVWDDDNNTEYTAQTPISLVGTEFQLDTVPYNKGGTGLTSYTEGDLLYASADNVLAKLARGSSGDILRMNGTGTLPEWRSQYGATSPITLTGGTTFELGTVPYNLGGTGQTGYNQGDMLYASLTNNLTKINIGTTGQVLKVASGISIPEWADETDTTYTATSPIFLAGTDFRLTTIPILLGGTNIVSYTQGDILYCSSSTGQGTLSKLPIGTAGKVLKVSSGGIPEWGDDNNTEYTAQTPLSLVGTEFQLGTVPYNKGGTGLTSYTQGDLLYASADNVLAKLGKGNSGDILRMNGTGTLPEWRTMYGATSPIVLTGGTTFELTTVPYNLGGTGQTGYNQGDMLYASSTNNLTKINIGSPGQVLSVASGSSIPEWTTPSGASKWSVGDSGLATEFIYPTTSSQRVVIGQATNTNDYRLRVNGDTYTEAEAYIDAGATNHALRIIGSGHGNGAVGISWYKDEADARIDNTRRAYVFAGTDSNNASTVGNLYLHGSNSTHLSAGTGSIFMNDYVGFMSSTANYPIEVGNYNNHNVGTCGFIRYIVSTNTMFVNPSAQTTRNVSIRSVGDVWVNSTNQSVIISSDRRIKTNIEDVPDNFALEQLRQIPTRQYEFIDKLTFGNQKQIGFIAQEVKEIMPNAVQSEGQDELIADVFKIIDCKWNGNKMSSTDLPNIVSGIEYKFTVSNTIDNEDEKEIVLVGNEDNTFTFDNQYTTVFCYGRKVKDFHTIDYGKLHTLNFSATQQLDKIQQTHITKIASLEAENELLKQELASIRELLTKNNIV